MRINSPTVPDGYYFLQSADRQIEIQWIHGIGSRNAAAPQARLMATVINGILQRTAALGTHPAWRLSGEWQWRFWASARFLLLLAFIIPSATTLAIFCGGVVRWLVERAARKAGEQRKRATSAPARSIPAA